MGDPFYEIGQKATAWKGRAIFISAVDLFGTLDLLAFHKGRHADVGIDTIALNSVETGAILRALVPGFAAGVLRPSRAPSLRWRRPMPSIRRGWGRRGTGASSSRGPDRGPGHV